MELFALFLFLFLLKEWPVCLLARNRAVCPFCFWTWTCIVFFLRDWMRYTTDGPMKAMDWLDVFFRDWMQGGLSHASRSFQSM